MTSWTQEGKAKSKTSPLKRAVKSRQHEQKSRTQLTEDFRELRNNSILGTSHDHKYIVKLFWIQRKPCKAISLHTMIYIALPAVNYIIHRLFADGLYAFQTVSVVSLWNYQHHFSYSMKSLAIR